MGTIPHCSMARPKSVVFWSENPGSSLVGIRTWLTLLKASDTVRLLRVPKADVRCDAIEVEAIEGQQLAILTAINSRKRIEPKDTRDYAFGLDVGQTAGRNREFLIVESLRDLSAGQFHVPHTISEGFSQRPQPLATIQLHDLTPQREIF